MGRGALPLGEVVLDNQGRDIRLDRMEAYVSQFALHDVDEGWVNVDTVQRIRFAEEGNHVVLDLPGCEDRHIDGLRMGLGVPADQNLDVDPAGYPADHPLGFAGSAGMHWGWAAGYIFSVYDGRLLVDLNNPSPTTPETTDCTARSSSRGKTPGFSKPGRTPRPHPDLGRLQVPARKRRCD